MENNRELDIARFIVEKTHSNLFLTGKAGTGKTTFLRDVRRYTKKKHIVLAPTGVAAVNAGGMTIHSFFQFGFGPYVRGVYEPEPNYHLNRQKLELIRNLELIVIDEISMVRADLLDHINDELQRIRRRREPFGGVQLLLIGDLQQLPPIAKNDEAELLSKRYVTNYFFDSLAIRNSEYYRIELKKVYRQSEQKFIDILNRARVGRLTDEDVTELNSRYIWNFRPEQGDNYIRLVTHNRQADEINSDEMSRLDTPSYTFDARVSSGFSQDSFPTNEHLLLKNGAQVMFVRNDSDRRFVNGSLGEVVSVDEKKVRVRIYDSGRLVDVEPATWESVRYKFNPENGQVETEVKGSFKQYPLKPAWAITVHKSQGLTFDKAVIDIHGAFSSGQAYVALSRCRSLDGIVFREKVTPRLFITDSVVEDYLNGTAQDVEAIAVNVGYEYFDYDRSSAPEPRKSPVRAKKINTTAKSASDPASPNLIKTTAGTDVSDAANAVSADVLSALKRWRYAKASELRLPGYCVFPDKTLAGIAEALPGNRDELLAVSGVGMQKLERFGDDVLAIVGKFASR